MNTIKCLTPTEAFELSKKDNVFLFDMRKPEDYAIAHAQGSLHLNPRNFDDFKLKFDDDTIIILICYVGKSSLNMALSFMEQGIENVYSVTTGTEGWIKDGLPMEK